MEYIATIYTVGGYYYLGPDSDVSVLVFQAKEAIEDGTGEYLVEQVYVHPANEDCNMPDCDQDPVWGYSRK